MSLLENVEHLKKASLPEVREAVARKVSHFFTEGLFDREEMVIACDIISLLARDVEVRVRRSLAEHIKLSPDLPRETALVLANDVLEVSLPVLEFSPVLTSDDMLAIITGTKEVSKWLAISRRPDVTEKVSDALIATNDSNVVVSLFQNRKAKISEASMAKASEYFAENGQVVQTLMQRGNLPIGVVEKMLAYVSDVFKATLIKEYKLSPSQAERLSTDSREKSTLDLLEDNNDPMKTAKVVSKEMLEAQEKKKERTEELVRHLYQKGRLTHSIVLRALCEGNLLFFQMGIARLAGIPTGNVKELLARHSKKGFEALCQKANIPKSTIDAMFVMAEFSMNCQIDNSLEKSDFSKRLIEHIMAEGYDKDIPLMPYMMALIGNNIAS